MLTFFLVSGGSLWLFAEIALSLLEKMQTQEILRILRLPELSDLGQFFRSLSATTLVSVGALAAVLAYWLTHRPKALQPPCNLLKQSEEVEDGGGARRSVIGGCTQLLTHYYDDARTMYQICVKGPNVFKGYLKDEDRTKEALDSDGWLHTGDIGKWLPEGTLKIIDRKKHIFKLAQGEYVAPEKIENIYIRSEPVAQIYVHGDSLKAFLVGIVVPDPEVMPSWAQKKGIEGTYQELCMKKNDLELLILFPLPLDFCDRRHAPLYQDAWGLPQGCQAPWYRTTELASPCSGVLGHVGAPLPCNHIKLVDAEELNYWTCKGEGEICVKLQEGPSQSDELCSNIIVIRERKESECHSSK